MTKIDDSTVVPIGWMVGLLIFSAAGIWSTAIWVKGVNDGMHSFESRFSRIEKALHIETARNPDLETQNPFVNSAEAGISRIIDSENPSRKREKYGRSNR